MTQAPLSSFEPAAQGAKLGAAAVTGGFAVVYAAGVVAPADVEKAPKAATPATRPRAAPPMTITLGGRRRLRISLRG
jgi:hypothetical protein